MKPPLPSISQNPTGVHHRYNIEKADGSPVDPEAEYFVLRLDDKADFTHRDACLRALAVYVANIAPHLPQLAAELHQRHDLSSVMTGFEQAWHSLCTATLATHLEKGFGMPESAPVEWDENQIALMHGELSEAHEGLRGGLMDDKLPHRPAVEVELADVVIRIMNYAAQRHLDVAGAIIEKAAYNKTRPFKHGEKKF